MKLKDTGLSREELKKNVEDYMIYLGERYDMIADTASGTSVYDENGEAYLDFYAGIAVSSAGNCNPRVVEAICKQAHELIHASNYPYSVPQAMLAKLICENIGMDKIFFQNSGTEANEAMIKLARKYGTDHYGPERYHIVTAKGSFHGRTYGALSATGQPDNGCQKGYQPVLPGFTYADFNDLESFKAACTKDTIAIMLEPVMGEGGVFPATKEFMQGIRRFCDENDMLLLLDEVQTGWGRTGALMAYMDYGVKPDIVTMAKAMGGGMPIGAISCRAELAGTLAGAHGSTYGGNPVCCAAAYAQISEILEKKLAENARETGAYFMQKLAELPHVKEVRGKGLMIGVEFEPEVKCGDVKHACFAHRFLVTATGHNTIRIVPPLTVTKELCDEAIARFSASICDVSA
ncbi:MAG: acetylornithine/succinylornithine family transaminase [Lachnospiraceae bacterium]|nr:acetylornithine/succinylornithine family transaminase [Lachnospiraceae bacterium]